MMMMMLDYDDDQPFFIFSRIFLKLSYSTFEAYEVKGEKKREDEDKDEG